MSGSGASSPAPDAHPRPGTLVLVVGTGTGVGKTWVTAGLLRVFRERGVPAVGRKLAQSYGPEDDPETRDASVLGAAGGEAPEVVCPPHRWYPLAMAPPMAAEALGSPPFGVLDLVRELKWPPRSAGMRVGLVETAGGVRSPQAADGDAGTLAGCLRPDRILVVADAGLGTINAALLTVEALPEAESGRRAPPFHVVLNRFDPDSDLHHRNRRWLEDRAALPVAVTPGDEARLATWVLGAADGGTS